MSTFLEPSSIREIAERGFGVLAFGTAPDGLTWLTRIDAPPSAEDLLCWRLCRTLDNIVGARWNEGSAPGALVSRDHGSAAGVRKLADDSGAILEVTAPLTVDIERDHRSYRYSARGS